MTTANDDADSLFQPDGTLRPEFLGEGMPAVLQEAVRQAGETNWDSVTTPHLFMGLLAVSDAGIRNWGKHLQADLPKLLRQLQELFQQEGSGRPPIGDFRRSSLTEQVVHLLAAAHSRAMSRGRTRLTPLDLLIAIFTTKTNIAQCFEPLGVSAEQMVELATLAEQETDK